jgi:hypothetical protein
MRLEICRVDRSVLSMPVDDYRRGFHDCCLIEAVGAAVEAGHGGSYAVLRLRLFETPPFVVLR